MLILWSTLRTLLFTAQMTPNNIPPTPNREGPAIKQGSIFQIPIFAPVQIPPIMTITNPPMTQVIAAALKGDKAFFAYYRY